MRAPIPLLFLLLPVAYAATFVYEYGHDDPQSEEIDYKEGYVGFFQKWTSVRVNVPVCFKLTYVFVKVENDVSVPQIEYDKDSESVLIVYNLLSDSRSNYTVFAKGVFYCVLNEGPDYPNGLKYPSSPYSDDVDYMRPRRPFPFNPGKHNNEEFDRVRPRQPKFVPVPVNPSGSYNDDDERARPRIVPVPVNPSGRYNDELDRVRSSNTMPYLSRPVGSSPVVTSYNPRDPRKDQSQFRVFANNPRL